MKKIILALVAICVAGLAIAEQQDEYQKYQKHERAKEVAQFLTQSCNSELEVESLNKQSEGARSYFVVQDPTDSIVWEPVRRKLEFQSKADLWPYLIAQQQLLNMFRKISNQENDISREQALELVKSYQDELKAQGGEVEAGYELIKFDPADPIVRNWLNRIFVFHEIKNKTEGGKIKCTNQMVAEAFSIAGEKISKLDGCKGLPIKTFPLVIGADSLICDQQLISILMN
jgi:hypothetical protein